MAAQGSQEGFFQTFRSVSLQPVLFHYLTTSFLPTFLLLLFYYFFFYFFDGLSADIYFTDSLSNQKHSQREEKGGLSSTAPSDSE